jgi:hypothetical protein
MKPRRLLLILSLALAASVSAWAGDQLTLRLVDARNVRGISAEDKELQDVNTVLRNSLPFNSFTLLDTQRIKLPADSTVAMARGFKVTCSGPQEKLTIRVEQGGKELLSTSVELQDSKPLIIGGFANQGGRLILVVVAR